MGGNSPVVLQTMWKDKLSTNGADGEAGIVRRIEGLGRMGCGLLCFAVPDIASAEMLGRIAAQVSMPLVADIHFDHKIALRCLDFPIAKIRINPGNIGPFGDANTRKKVKDLLEKAALNNRPIRIGVNAGSLPPDLRKEVAEGRMDNAEALVLTAERELAVFREFGFDETIVSMKASGIADTIKANRFFAERSNIPLHIGITEAGPLLTGAVRSSAALSQLLAEGIGDTVRISLSDSVENEIIAAKEICRAAAELALLNGNAKAAERLKQGGVTIISCPKCGRSSFDTHAFTERWLNRLYATEKNITAAVMGCEVNGPEEARHADLGITGCGNKVLLFRQGRVVRTVSASEADEAFEQELAGI